MTEDDEEDLDPHHHDAPDPSDWNDEPAEVKCPNCRREVSEEAEQCTYCGYYITREDAPARGKPWWWILVVVLLLLIFLRYLW
jgi:hypothetical protein